MSGPYLGQTPPGTTPAVFAPGIVSNPSYTEWAGAFSPDGTEYYFYRFSETSPSELMSSRIVDGAWTNPEPLTIAGVFTASEAHLTFDNRRLYFMSNRPVPGGQSSFVGGGGYYVATRTPGGWSEPIYAGQGMFLSSTRAGQLYTTDMASVPSEGRTYLAEVETDATGRFAEFRRLAVEPSLGYQAHPCIAPDGRYLLFDVSGGQHLFVSFRRADGTWGKGIDLATNGFDPRAGGATISPDGRYLFFHLGGDIWWVDAQVIERLAPES